MRGMRVFSGSMVAAFLLASAALAAPPVQPATPSPAPAAGTAAKPAMPVKPLVWNQDIQKATVLGQKQDKLMLVYFCGSGWDDWTTKLDKEVMNTPAFMAWAEQNVIPVKIDFPKDAEKQNAAIKRQNEDLRVKFSISKVPTFLFIDPAQDVLARVGYDVAKWRDGEAEGDPKTWIEFCTNVVKTRPIPEPLANNRTLEEGVKLARQKGIPLLLLLTKDPTPVILQERDNLLGSAMFARFVNRNVIFASLAWPSDTDQTPEAKYFREFAAKWKFGPAPIQLIFWDPGGLGELKAQIMAGVSVNNVNPLVKRLDALMPRIDYNGGWIDDWKKARAIAHQQKRDIFIAFVSTDSSEWSKKMDEEIFSAKEFKDYAYKNLVLLRADFPRTVQQTPDLKEQNKMLADMYAVRGYPTVIMLNPLGQKLFDGKYMKGGAPVFLKEMKDVREADKNRRNLPSDIATGNER